MSPDCQVRESQRAATAVAPRQTVHWIIAGLLSVIATCLVLREGHLFGTPAMAQQGMLGARGLYAFTGPIDRSRYGLWMMDVDAGTVWCYEYNPAKRRMRLVAARSFRFDRYLEDYNQDEPTPDQVAKLVEQGQRSRMRAENLLQAAPPLGVPPAASEPSRPAGPAVTGS